MGRAGAGHTQARSGAGMRQPNQGTGGGARFLAMLRADQERPHRPDRGKSMRTGCREAATGTDAPSCGGQAQPRPASCASGRGGRTMRPHRAA